MSTPSPTIQRWKLGQELRRLRVEHGIQPAAAARALGVTPSNLSRIEGGKQTIREPHVRVIASLTGVTGDELDVLLTMCEESAQPEWYHAMASSAPRWFRDYLGFESAATSISTYGVELVDGLMQTEAYARAVANGTQPLTRAVDSQISLRLARQERLLRAGAPHLHVVLNQLALVTNVGGPDVMHAQIQRILDLIEMAHVTLQVLPFGSGVHPAMTSGFSLLGFDDAPNMATVYLENGRGAVYLDAEADLARYDWAFTRLTELALSPDESRELLAR